VQELVDQFVMKLRIVRQLRTPDYNELFAGDPTWVTAVLGGTDPEGKWVAPRPPPWTPASSPCSRPRTSSRPALALLPGAAAAAPGARPAQAPPHFPLPTPGPW
jgi:hypothetical protein